MIAALLSNFKSLAPCFAALGAAVTTSGTIWGFLSVLVVATACVMIKRIDKDKAHGAIDKLSGLRPEGAVTLTCGDLVVIVAPKPSEKPPEPSPLVQSPGKPKTNTKAR